MLNRLKNNFLVKKVKKRFPRLIVFIKEVIHILNKKEVGLLPNYIAFLILLSFIPILTLIFEVIYLSINNNAELLVALSNILPGHIYTILVRLLDHNTGHVSILTITNLTLLFIASQIYLAFYKSYLFIFNVEKHPHFIKERIIAIINTFLLIILVFFLSVLTVFNSYVYELVEQSIQDYSPILFIFNYASLALSITVIITIVTFLMYSVPDIKQRIRDVFPGALFVTLGWILVSFIFKIYVDNYSNYESIYKTFNTIIVFVTWVYLISMVMIIGIAINKALQNLPLIIKSKNKRLILNTPKGVNVDEE